LTSKVESVDTSMKSEAATSRPRSITWGRIAHALSSVSPLVVLLVVLTTMIYSFVAHVDGKLGNNDKIRFVSPEVTSGDEPHYMVVISSILFDHDIRIDEDHERIAAGGYEAGARWKGRSFGGHSVLINQRTGAHALCHQDCAADEMKAVGGNKEDQIQVPAHPIAYPAFVALLAWPFHPDPAQLEPLIGELQVLISIAGVLLAYFVARQSGLGARAAVGVALLLGFASSWLPYARSYFAESSIGLFLLLGYLALRVERPFFAGLAIGIATAMKSNFIVFGFAWIAERLLARRYREAFWLTVSTGLCGLAQVCANLILLKSPVTYGSAPWSSAHGLNSFTDTLVHPTQGLLLFIPWALIPFLWGMAAARRGQPSEPGMLTRDARQQVIVPILLCLLAYSVIGWGPGFCYGPRYWIPVLPFMALLTIDFVVAGKEWRAWLVGVMAAVAMLIAIPGAIKYRLLYSKPPTAALFVRPGS
jgi:hypothetical protein